MYIAFKWLVVLAFMMWLAMCVVDLILKENMKIRNAGLDSSLFENFKNKSMKMQLQSDLRQETLHLHRSYYEAKGKGLAGLHFVMFLAGALAVTAFHKKQYIITFANRKMCTINVGSFFKIIKSHMKQAATKLRAISKYVPYSWKTIKMISFLIYNKVKFLKLSYTVKYNKIQNNIILIKKLKEMAEERKKLGQILISALHENKKIRMRYELETMTKNRLMQHIEDTQKQLKENRSTYVRFQHLYLVTHQENIFLKARLKKLKQEKDETEKNLMGLIYEVYKSKNSKLKAYCTSFIVQTKDKMLNSDVNTEIKEFLEKSKPSETIRTIRSKQSNAEVLSSTSIRILEIINEDDILVPKVSDVPKLRGLSGEYVWTVKDKDGIIEKLYEYEFDSDLDSGDTIRRIRQYSVYYDKDCLLDFSKVEANTGSPGCPSRSNMLNYPLSNKNIVTGSAAFQKFLQNNKSVVQTTAPPLLRG